MVAELLSQERQESSPALLAPVVLEDLAAVVDGDDRRTPGCLNERSRRAVLQIREIQAPGVRIIEVDRPEFMHCPPEAQWLLFSDARNGIDPIECKISREGSADDPREASEPKERHVPEGTCDTFALGQIDEGICSKRAQRARQNQESIWTSQSNWIGDRVVDQAAPGQNRQGLSDSRTTDLVGQDKAGGVREDSVRSGGSREEPRRCHREFQAYKSRLSRPCRSEVPLLELISWGSLIVRFPEDFESTLIRSRV